MTEKTQPTDAELKAMWQLHAADIGGIFHYARAVLAKWGQPAQAAEPVAREPLTDAEIAEEIVERGVMDVAWPSQRRLNQFARAIERAHGITKEGGQHGTESST